MTPFNRTDTLHPLASVDDLATALAQSASQPVFLFKHSDSCGMSWQAHEEVRMALADPDWATTVFLVTVQRSRPVSNAIADRLQVRHASPQMLLVTHGEVRWQASHMAITADAMRRAVATYGGPPPRSSTS